VPQRDPIITAKSVASLDQLSDGRFIFAIGGGWNVEEMENHGASYATRFRLLREQVLAMKALWTQEQAEFHGEFVNFDPAGLGRVARRAAGGGSGIRTHDTVSRIHAFQACAFSHSAIPPRDAVGSSVQI
jgi:alkanesulfonate monooxygenase SsuD/methylene tetrahydromethanopterin reductase-like flavin-dependent oxidoreductase (luciferase family)